MTFGASGARSVEAGAYPLAGAYPGALLRFALAFVVIGPPCFLMGGTRPSLVKAFAGLGVGIGRSAGMLHVLNTLGAALGACLVGLDLLPELGIQTTTRLASATSVGIVILLGIGELDPLNEFATRTQRSGSGDP